ncbi:restriction endonuclease subunit S [Vibrio splendidus]
MSELPKGWIETNFEDVSDYIQRGKGPKYTEHSDYPVVNQKAVRWFGLQEEHLKYVHPEQWEKWDEQRYIRLGDILWNSTGTGTIGRACHVDETQLAKAKVVDSHVTIVRTNELVESKFAFYWIKHPEIQNNINGLYNGSTNQVELSKKIVQSTRFPLAPLAEQKRIVEKLDEVLAQVDTIKARLDGIPDLLKRFRQSVLASATSGEISKNWRELNSPLISCQDDVVKKVFTEWCKSKEAEFSRKDKIPKNDKWKEKFPELDFGENPVSCWHAINLASVAEVIDPNPSHRMPKYVDDGLPFISSENIVNLSCIDFVKGKKIQEEELEKQKTRYEVRDGTFAFTRIGTIGKSVLLPVPHNYGVSHAMAIVNPFKSLIESRFLILTMNCKSILSQAHEGVQSVGVPDLGIGKMKSFIIPLPSIEEQKEIVRLVDQYFAFADTIEAQVKKAQARVDNLTQSILAKAFRGELVPQDPNDEPAEKLLERIAEARKEAEALAKAAKKAEAARKKAAKAK